MQELTINLAPCWGQAKTGSAFVETFRYPGGEWQVRLTPGCLDYLKSLSADSKIKIIAKVFGADDWARLLLLLDAISEESNREKNLILPYLPYGRADRRFVPGDCSGLETFVKSLSSYNCRICTYDVHSSVSEFLRIENIRPVSEIQKSIHKILGVKPGNKEVWGYRECSLLFPDAGAMHRYCYFASFVEYQTAVKERDGVSGMVFGLKSIYKPQRKKVLVVDDICDGGATFVELAKSFYPDCEYYLYVTHGIFSQGVGRLIDAGYKHIFTTDSFDPKPHKNLTIHPLRYKLDEPEVKAPF